MILTTVEIEKIKDFDEQGFYSSAYLALDKRLDRVIAVKDINVGVKVTEEDLEAYFHEALKLSQSEHPRILPVYFVGFCSTNGDEATIPRIVTKYMSKGTLTNVLREQYDKGLTLPLDKIIRYSHDIIQSLIHLHSLDILHLDLKASNIFMGDDGKLVIGDFGQSRFIENGIVSDASNLYPSITPDEFVKKGVVDKTADIFQFGILFFSMCNYDIYRSFIENEYAIDVETLKGLFTDPANRDKEAIKQFGDNLKRYKEDLKAGLFTDSKNCYNYIPVKIIDIIRRCIEPKVEDRYNNFYQIQEDLNSIKFPKGVSNYCEIIGEEKIIFNIEAVECLIDYSIDSKTKKYTLNPFKGTQNIKREKVLNVTSRTLRKELFKLAAKL
jgi:serine/threonine protein kinase